MTTPSLLVLGNANVDLVLGEVDGWPAIGTEVMVERSEMRAGGSAGNTALALTGLGVPHLFVASTGDDPNGAWLRSQFDSTFCDWIVDRCDTTVTVGIVHKGGDRAFFTTPGHLQTARLDDLLSRLPTAPHDRSCAIVSGGFLMPNIMAGTSRLLSALKAHGWMTAIDPGWTPDGWNNTVRALLANWLVHADFALLNEEEAKGFAALDDLDQAAKTIADGMAMDQSLVIKRGKQGAAAYRAGTIINAPSSRVRVIDTVGAGDTFNAAFLASIAQNGSLDLALKEGVRIAAHAISTFPRRYESE